MGKSLLVLSAAVLLAGGASWVGDRQQVRAETAAAPFLLGWPVACSVGRNCWVQNYVDRDPGPRARDYTCGSLTYDAHNGTDIRLPDMAAERAGVNVLAAADGRVLRVRDAMADVSVRVAGLASVKGVECGNGLVIDHGNGWTTQYCHMAKGSLVVRPGQQVRAGDVLGHVGLSGETEFPHLHISVWRGKDLIDPFAPDPGGAATCGGGAGLWKIPPHYAPRSVINAGFAAAPLEMSDVEAGDVPRARSGANYLVAYVRSIGLRQGDEVSFSLTGPNGAPLAAPPPTKIIANQAQRFMYVGKRRPAAGWPAGVYKATYSVSSGGRPGLTYSFEIRL